MLKTLKGILSRAKKLDHHKVMKKALDEKGLQAQIIDLNTTTQLYEKGIDAFGRELGEYSQATIYGTARFAGKIEKGQRYDHITLNDSGKFYASFRIINQADGFTIRANTIKDGQDLANIFGNKIIGLTQESKAEITPELSQRMREISLQTIFKRNV